MPSSTVTSIFCAADTLLNSTLLGETVIYIFYATGLSKQITMRLDRGINLGRDKTNRAGYDLGANNAVSTQAIGYPSVSDVPLPEYLDKVTATGPGGNAEEWTVLNILETDSSCHTISLRSDLRPML